MSPQFRFSFLLAAATFLNAAGPLDRARQVLFVTSRGWNENQAVLQRFERPTVDAPWAFAGSRFAVSLGPNGMAWGRGLHPFVTADGPVKREGDNRSPAGVFSLPSAFGYFTESEVAGHVNLPYMHSRPQHVCVDDPRSASYNEIVDSTQVPTDWSSAEAMRRNDVLYRFGVTVDHNTSPTTPGAGSCIFLHIWRAPGATTAGCTAMAETSIRDVLKWLDPAAEPVLVQLPVREYSRYRAAWKLP